METEGEQSCPHPIKTLHLIMSVCFVCVFAHYYRGRSNNHRGAGPEQRENCVGDGEDEGVHGRNGFCGQDYLVHGCPQRQTMCHLLNKQEVIP
jgi:hypothetical protein